MKAPTNNSHIRKSMRPIHLLLSVLLVVLNNTAVAADKADDELRQRFEIMDPTACKKVKSKEPPLPRTSFFEGDTSTTALGYRERFYLNLDGSENCQILDVWIDRVNPADPNEYRQTALNVIRRYEKGKWIEEQELPYAPKYQLRDKTTGRIYYLLDFSFENLISAQGVWYFDGKWQDPKARVSPSIELCLETTCISEETLKKTIDMHSRKAN
jgi:hypothetical protein